MSPEHWGRRREGKSRDEYDHAGPPRHGHAGPPRRPHDYAGLPFFRPYYAGRLRRKIFVWFGVSIAVTAVVVMGVTSRSGPSGSQFLKPLIVAMVMLWAASGAIAHRLVRPLSELARVASDIGRGQLKSRVHLSHRHGREFHMVGDVMNDMASRIEKQLADQRTLLAAVSHEIRTPLSRMRLLIEFARDKTGAIATELAELRAKAIDASGLTEPVPAKDALADLAELEREVTEIDALVSDLLASSRVDFTALTHTTLEPAEVAKDALEKAGIDAARLEITGTGTFTGDATLALRAVSNLLENAKRHAGGAELLRVEITARWVVFVVEDRGPGFVPGEEKRVFEPFYKRADAASNGEVSVGLGLALVKKIAEAHRGRVFAENRHGGGARVGAAFAR